MLNKKGEYLMAHEVYKIDDFQYSSTPFKLLYVTRSEYDKGWHSTPHTHHFTELFYIIDGKGAFVLSNEEIQVEKNDLIIINPTVEHTEKSNKEDSLQYIALGIEGIAFTVPENQKIGLFTYRGNAAETLFYLEKLLDEVKENQENVDLICRSIIEILLVNIKREKSLEVESHHSRHLKQSVALAQHFIKHNYRESITLDDLAEVSHVNKYYLAHLFKQQIGVSPIEFLNQERITAAKDLLETTNFTITQISESTGFSSQSFFSQAFRRETGMTPSAFRKQTRSTKPLTIE